MEAPIGTVMSRLYTARRSLQRVLTKRNLPGSKTTYLRGVK